MLNSIKKEHKISPPSLSIEEVTPDLAREMLSLNTNNFRKVDQKRVDRYALDIANGNWELTGDTIKINDDVLIDGQTRLLAVIKANKSIRTAIAWNVAESGMFVDRGKPRTVGQWLKHLGIKDANNMAAAGKLILQHEKGAWGRQVFQTNEYSDTEIIEYVKNMQEELYGAIRLGHKMSGLMPVSIAAAMIHVGAGYCEPTQNELVTWFWNGVSTGNGLGESDPPLVLRNRLIASKINKNMVLSNHYIRWIATIAWNKAVKGEQISPHNLRIRSVGPQKQTPPSLILAADYQD